MPGSGAAGSAAPSRSISSVEEVRKALQDNGTPKIYGLSSTAISPVTSVLAIVAGR